MSRNIEPIKNGYTYHIFNKGTNGNNLFVDNENCEYFLKLYDKYISPIADTYAWVLIKNHFHMLIRIKEEVDWKLDAVANQKRLTPSQYFGHVFNSYAQAFNKRHKRSGSLFQHPFHRKLIDSDEYFRNIVLYIHNNPVHHGFVSHTVEYQWSSYLTCISEKPTRLMRSQVIEYFDDLENFKLLHDREFDIANIEEFLFN